MVQSYKKKLTYASKSQEKFSFFSFYKQISMSKIILYKKENKKALQSYNSFLNCAIVRKLFFEEFTNCQLNMTK